MPHVGILTTTFYRSIEDVRFHLACQMIGNAVGRDIPVLVVDASPDTRVAEAFDRIGAIVVSQKEQGMAPGRRELFATARDVKANLFLFTEPEKADLIRSVPRIVAPLEDGRADIVIPHRTEASFGSYPSFQRESEEKANAVYRDATGFAFDPMFGPVAFTRAALGFFALCDPTRLGVTTGYIQHIAPLEALGKGLRVTEVFVDFFYPPIQRLEEENDETAMRAKRSQQLEELTAAYRTVGKRLRKALA